MRRIILVRSDLLKALHSTEGTELSAEEKIRKILELRVQEAKTEDERQRATLELRNFVATQRKAPTRKAASNVSS